jgi:hypothetical protein
VTHPKTTDQCVIVFDGVIACDFPLLEVPAASQPEADIHVATSSGTVDESGYNWIHSWRETDGELVLSCARRIVEGEESEVSGAPQYLLRFPGLADFVITDNLVNCYPHADCRDDSLRHLVLDQVIPRMWAHKGHLVLHASAVRLPSGQVVAFIGDSGWGKSTLAAALRERGSQLLSDDTVSLRPSKGQVQLIPSYTGLRLNEDSIATLGMAAENWGTVAHYSDKQRLAHSKIEDLGSLWLDILYVMEPPAEAQILSIKPMSGAGLITTLIKRSFLLDVNDAACAARQMGLAGAVMRALPSVHSLSYPRDYQQLPALCDALMGEGSQ